MTRLTTKNTINSTILIAITAILSTTMINAFATDYYSGNKWAGTSVDVCYGTSLGNLNINGQTNQFNTAASQIDGARNDWNDEPSVWVFNKVSSCTHWFYATSLGSTGAVAETYRVLSGSTITDMDTAINKDYTFVTSNTCSLPPYYLQYVATHELGHWLRLLHSSGSPSDSVMYGAANCAGITVKTHDSSTLTSIYG